MRKQIHVEAIDSIVTISRRKGTRNLRISMKSDGTIMLSIPYGVSDSTAEQFISSKADWLIKHKQTPTKLKNNHHIGKSHRLVILFDNIEKPKTRLRANEVTVTLPYVLDPDSELAQEVIKKACEKALKKESEALIPQRLEYLSKKHAVPYKSISVKKLKGRWGSCDTHKNIIINIYLIQQDWSLIDYVLLHELTHTIHAHHQSDFWNYLENLLPDYKERKKTLKTQPTNVIDTKF